MDPVASRRSRPAYGSGCWRITRCTAATRGHAGRDDRRSLASGVFAHRPQCWDGTVLLRVSYSSAPTLLEQLSWRKFRTGRGQRDLTRVWFLVSFFFSRVFRYVIRFSLNPCIYWCFPPSLRVGKKYAFVTRFPLPFHKKTMNFYKKTMGQQHTPVISRNMERIHFRILFSPLPPCNPPSLYRPRKRVSWSWEHHSKK